MKRTTGMTAYAFVLMLMLGLVYAWSVFASPLEAEFGWNRAETSMAYTLSMIFFSAGVFCCYYVMRFLSLRKTLWFSAALLLIGFGVCSQLTAVWQLYVFYGIFCGYAVGTAYGAILHAVLGWYPGKTGFISGILMMAYGMGGLVFSSLVSALLNGPIGWRTTFIILGIAFAAILVGGSFVLRVPEAAEAKPGQATARDIPPSKVLRKPSLYVFYLWSLMTVGLGMMVIGQAAPTMESIGATAAVSALAVGLLSVGNGLGRVLCGISFDKLGRYRTTLGTSALFILGSVLMWLAYMNKNSSLLMCAYPVIGMAFGSSPPMQSAFTRTQYGSKYYQLNFGIINTQVIIGTPTFSAIVSTLYMRDQSYTGMTQIMLIMAALILFLTVLLERTLRREAGIGVSK